MAGKNVNKKQQGFLENYFELSKYGTTVKTELLAGLTTFITVAYILIIIPLTVSEPYVIMGDSSYASQVSNGVFIATCIGAFIGRPCWWPFMPSCPLPKHLEWA